MVEPVSFRVWIEVEAFDADGEALEYEPLPDFSSTGPVFDTEAGALAFAEHLHIYGISSIEAGWFPQEDKHGWWYGPRPEVTA